MQLATGRQPQKGYVLDYTAVISTTNLTLQNDTTYYVSGSVNLSGTTVFEGGTVIKFAPTNNACLNVATALCRGSMYHPSIFTARDDNTVGQTISGSTGNPTTNFYARAMLALGDNSPLSYLRMSYAAKAVEISGGYSQYSLSHAQLNKCQLALNILNDNDNVFTLNNVLMCNVANLGNAGNFSYYGAHLTFDHVTNQTGELYFHQQPVCRDCRVFRRHEQCLLQQWQRCLPNGWCRQPLPDRWQHEP